MSLGSTLSTSNGSTSSSRTRSGSCTSSGMVQQLAAQLSHMPGLYLRQEWRRSTSTMLMGDLMVGGWACAGPLFFVRKPGGGCRAGVAKRGGGSLGDAAPASIPWPSGRPLPQQVFLKPVRHPLVALVQHLGGQGQDRKSVVQGKSVDLGGRRIIQKKRK